ncbi:MAG: glycosyltransferase family 2 protein [Patescibacteria group bacterium]
MAQIPKTVSVIIPTRNRPELLKKAITSVQNQTYRDFELIVIEDTEGKGGGWARNKGIKQAQGKFIAFLDDDDEWIPEKLEDQMSMFTGTPADVGFSFSAVRNVTDDRTFDTKVPEGIQNYFEYVLARFKTFLNVTLIIKCEVFNDVGMFDERFPSHQEADLMVRVTKKYRGLGINKPLTIVNMRGGRERVGTSLRRRIQGREMILEKHTAEFVSRPQFLAAHYFQLGLWNRDGGYRQRARSYFLKAWRTHQRYRYLLHYMYTYFL